MLSSELAVGHMGVCLLALRGPQKLVLRGIEVELIKVFHCEFLRIDGEVAMAEQACSTIEGNYKRGRGIAHWTVLGVDIGPRIFFRESHQLLDGSLVLDDSLHHQIFKSMIEGIWFMDTKPLVQGLFENQVESRWVKILHVPDDEGDQLST